MSLREAIRPALTTVFAASLAVSAVALPGPQTALWLSAKTVLMLPGNADPDGVGLESKLNGYFDDAGPNFGFPGYRTVKVPWLSDSFDLDPGYAISQADGLDKLHTAVTQYRNVDDDEDDDRLVVVGYSSGAIVVIDEMQRLDSAPDAPSPDQVEFFVFGSPQRPNGGIFARFPDLAVGDIVFTGANPDTRYQLTDIGYEYDPVSDFPAYPLLPLTLLNAIMGFPELHIDYAGRESDLDNAIDSPTMTYDDPTRGISYVTIAAPHLPLLMPLYRVIDQVPVLRPLVEPILKLVEPTLKVLVDLGYRRDIPVGEAVPAGLFPRLDLAKVIAELAHSVVEGFRDAFAGTPAPQSPPAASAAAPPPPITAVERADSASELDTDAMKPRSQRRAPRTTSDKRAEADQPSVRQRPGRPRESASDEDPHAVERPDRRKDNKADARPGRGSAAEKAGPAKMDSVKRTDRRQAADAA